MRYTTDHSDETRARVLEAAGRAFRKHGFGGIGVDGLGKSADVTSGAIYSHFKSKSGAFQAVVSAGIERLRQGVAYFQAKSGAIWLPAFASYYLGEAHRADVAGGCAMPSLSGDVGRSDQATRVDYETALLKVADLIAAGLPAGSDRSAAWPILARLAGGVLIARAVYDPALAKEIADAVLRDLTGEFEAGTQGVGVKDAEPGEASEVTPS